MRPYLIGVTGGSGSGKTWLTNHLAARLPAEVLPLDSYYRDLPQLDFAERARQNFDAPEALDWELIHTQTRTLAEGRPAGRPVYDFTTHRRRPETARITPGRFLIVEGLFALWSEAVRALCGTKVFLAVNSEACLRRRLARDVAERGRTAESVRGQWADTVLPSYERWVLPTRQFADLVLSGEDRVEGAGAAVEAHIAGNHKEVSA